MDKTLIGLLLCIVSFGTVFDTNSFFQPVANHKLSTLQKGYFKKVARSDRNKLVKTSVLVLNKPSKLNDKI